MKLFRAILNSIYWVRALQLAARGEYCDASKALDNSSYKKYEYWSLNAFIPFALQNDELALESSKEAKRLVTTESISELDKNYMHGYLSDLENNILGSEFDLNIIEINGVSKHLLKNFPLRGHPDWISV